jgi:hypothetical protein
MAINILRTEKKKDKVVCVLGLKSELGWRLKPVLFRPPK